MLYDNMRNRRLALLLLDIVGSTAFIQKVGGPIAARVFQHHDRLARSLCYKNSGREIDRSDGFLMSFESVQDAIQFALDYNDKVTPKIKLKARIGIHWGTIVEVTQQHIYVEAGAKRVELEGIAKNVAARTMSIAMPSQILITADAYRSLVQSARMRLSGDLRTACVGVYRFKGVRDPVSIYAVSKNHELLQPPPGNDKAKRLGGPAYVRKLARDRKIRDYLIIVMKVFMYLGTPIAIYILYKVLCSRQLLSLLGIYDELYWLHITATYLREVLF